jgi:hypothetical protein
MFMPLLCVVLPPADREQLAQVVANGNTPQKLAVRASILLMLHAHVRPSHIATRLALSRNHVHYWMRRYLSAGVGGVLREAPRPGRRKRITAEQGRDDCRRYAADPSPGGDALDHPHDGQSAGRERGHRPPHLASARIATASSDPIQIVYRPTVRR